MKKIRLKHDFQQHKKGDWIEVSEHMAKTLIAKGWAVDYSMSKKKSK